jgi:hypothetical protein
MLGSASTTSVDVVDESPKLSTVLLPSNSTDFTMPIAAGVLLVLLATGGASRW